MKPLKLRTHYTRKQIDAGAKEFDALVALAKRAKTYREAANELLWRYKAQQVIIRKLRSQITH